MPAGDQIGWSLIFVVIAAVAVVAVVVIVGGVASSLYVYCLHLVFVAVRTDGLLSKPIQQTASATI